MKDIEIKNLTFSYDENDSDSKNVHALENINLEIEKGEFVALLGSNGSGKSTLAKLINGLLTPTDGDVFVLEMNTKNKKQLFEIRKNCGMVFQNPDNQMIATIVEDDIAFGPENIGIKREEIGERISYALNAVGMSEFRNATPHRLSGGQKQRIAIAGVLAIKPRILIFDESTAMLDPKGRKEILKIAHKLNKEEGITVIHITHFMEEAVFADRIVVMHKGRIVVSGKPQDVFSNDAQLNAIGLAVPKTMQISNYLYKKGYNITPNILDEETLAEELCELLLKD